MEGRSSSNAGFIDAPAGDEDYMMEGEEYDEDEYYDDEYMYEDEIVDPKERKKEGKPIQLPAKVKTLAGKKAYKEYMESLKNQKRQQPINPDNMPLRHKIKKIFKNDHRYYSK